MQKNYMKILLVNRTAKEIGENGHKRHALIRQTLEKENIVMDILASDVDYIHNTKRQSNEKGTLKIKCLIAGENIFLRLLSQIEFSIRVLFFNAKKYDVLIGSSPDLLSAFSTYLISRKYNKKFFLEVRDIWPLSIKELVSLPVYPGYTLLESIEKYLYRRAKKIICTIPNFTNYLNDIGLKKHSNKVIWIPPFNLDVQNIVQQKKRSSKLKILYAGTLRKNNHIPSLLNYILFTKKKYGDFLDFHVLGAGPELKNIANEKHVFKIHKPITEHRKYIEFLSKFDVGIGYIKKSKIYNYGTSLNKVVDFLQARTLFILVGINSDDFYVKNKSIIQCNHSKHDFASKLYHIHKTDRRELSIQETQLGLNFDKLHVESIMLRNIKTALEYDEL